MIRFSMGLLTLAAAHAFGPEWAPLVVVVGLFVYLFIEAGR